MSFRKILCQDNIIQLFQGIIEKERTAHAYIFTGPDGVGKTLFARELAKTLFCESGGIDACDSCRACLRVESNNHPDVQWIIPDKKDKFIKIEHIHALQDSVYLKPVETDHKIFIISNAEKMNEESSNCLLKTLEEPPPDTMIILLTPSLKSLKKTIVSRCQAVRFNPLSSSTIASELATRFDTTPEVLGWAAQFSCGSLGRAIEFLEKGTFDRASYINKRLSSLKLAEIIPFSKEISEWDSYQGEPLEEKRSRLRYVLDIFLQFYRDALLCKIGIENVPLYNQHAKDILNSSCMTLGKIGIINIIEHIVTSIEYLDYNVKSDLVLENLHTKIAHAQS